MMKSEIKDSLLNSILHRVPDYHCPMCGSRAFTIVDGFSNEFFQDGLSHSINLGGRFIPTFLTVCNNCGFISRHAIGIVQPDLISSLNAEENKKI